MNGAGLRKIVRWTSSAALTLAGLYCLNVAAFHAWAGGVPPASRPGWHRTWSLRLVIAAVLCFGLAGLLVWWLRPRRVTDDEKR